MQTRRPHAPNHSNINTSRVDFKARKYHASCSTDLHADGSAEGMAARTGLICFCRGISDADWRLFCSLSFRWKQEFWEWVVDWVAVCENHSGRSRLDIRPLLTIIAKIERYVLELRTVIFPTETSHVLMF